jgi:cephalosporin hydroxylase
MVTALTLTDQVLSLGLTGYSPEEIELIYTTMSEYQPDLVIEWGTNIGTSARIFHEARQLLDLACVIHSVEIMPDLGDSWVFKRGHHVQGLPVNLHIGDGVTRGIELWHSSGAHRPLFFLDDNHAETEVLRQLRLIHLEAPQAVMLVHDTHTPFGDGLRLHEPGVAVQTFLQEADYVMVEVLVGQCMVRLWPR